MGERTDIARIIRITFAKNRRRDAFYYIKDGETEELSFVEAARIFHAVAKEKSISLHDQHHDHVNTAIKGFKESIEQNVTRDRVVEHKLGPNEKRSLKLLSPFIAHATLTSDGEKSLLKLAQTAVRRGAFAALPKKLVKLDKVHRKTPYKPAALLDEILVIIQEYPLRKDEEETSTPNSHFGYSSEDLAPKIILSESFDFPEE